MKRFVGVIGENECLQKHTYIVNGKMGFWNKQNLIINGKHYFERIFEVLNQVLLLLFLLLLFKKNI